MNQHGRINKNTEIKIVALEVTKDCELALFVCHIQTDNVRQSHTQSYMEFSRTKLSMRFVTGKSAKSALFDCCGDYKLT